MIHVICESWWWLVWSLQDPANASIESSVGTSWYCSQVLPPYQQAMDYFYLCLQATMYTILHAMMNIIYTSAFPLFINLYWCRSTNLKVSTAFCKAKKPSWRLRRWDHWCEWHRDSRCIHWWDRKAEIRAGVAKDWDDATWSCKNTVMDHNQHHFFFDVCLKYEWKE